MPKKPKEWTPPPPLGAPPRDPSAAMIHIESWWVFTVNGVPHLYEKKRTSWPHKLTNRKVFIGHDWIDHGPVTAPHPDCQCLHDIVHLVNEHLRGIA